MFTGVEDCDAHAPRCVEAATVSINSRESFMLKSTDESLPGQYCIPINCVSGLTAVADRDSDNSRDIDGRCVKN